MLYVIRHPQRAWDRKRQNEGRLHGLKKQPNRGDKRKLRIIAS